MITHQAWRQGGISTILYLLARWMGGKGFVVKGHHMDLEGED